MKKLCILINLLILSSFANAQSTNKPFVFDWESIKNNSKLPQREAAWLHDSLNNEERTKVLELVSALSRPAAAQLLVSQFYLDNSNIRRSMKPFIDSFSVRPPDGDAGIIRVAYLSAKLRQIQNGIRMANSSSYTPEFTGAAFKLPAKPTGFINKNIELSFDYMPAKIVMDILETPNMSYQDILKKVDTHEFEALYGHHSQSFYPNPLNKERMALCLEKAASTKPLDVLYRYINPNGLLNFSDVKTNLSGYKNQIATLITNETAIFDYIKATISTYLPTNAQFKRKVSFFFINDSDGWASDDVTAIDLNYYKDNYDMLIPVLAHETYHSGQSAVELKDSTKRAENVQNFVDIVNYLFMEGTASFIVPPTKKAKSDYDTAVSKGAIIFEDVYKNTIVKHDAQKAQDLSDAGIQGGGPFYWLGAEMSKTIVEVFGEEKLASIIPYQGIIFFKTYFDAVKTSKKHKNLFGSEVEKYMRTLK
jgi:hypothetical protein